MIRKRTWCLLLLLFSFAALFIINRQFATSRSLSSSSDSSELSQILGELPPEYARLLQFDLDGFRRGLPPQEAQPKNPPLGLNVSQVEDDKVFFDRDGRPIPWYTDFPYWKLHQRVKERGWEMAARAGLKSQGMGSAFVSKTALAKTEVYKDVTGFVKGSWSRVPSDLLVKYQRLPFLDKYKQKEPKYIYEMSNWGRNLTTDKGNVNIWFMEGGEIPPEYGGVRVRNIKAELDIESPNGEHDWRIVLYGLHSADTGAIVLASSSYKFPGTYALPLLALTDQHFLAFRDHFNKTIPSMLSKHGPFSKHSLPNPDMDDLNLPLCELIVYLQQYPLDQRSVEHFSAEDIERELRRPFGLQKVPTPDMKMSMIAYSPDCGYVLESDGPPLLMPKQADHLIGIRNDVFIARASRHLLGFAVILALHLSLLRRQVREADTPSVKNRISSWTMYILALTDGMVVFASLIFGTMTENLFKSFVMVCVAAGMSFVMGVAFLADVSAVQYEDAQRERRQEGASFQNNTFSLNSQPHIEGQATGVNAGYLDTGSVLILSADQANFISSPNDTTHNDVPSRGSVFRNTLFAAAALFIFSIYASHRSTDHGIYSHNWRRSHRRLYLLSLLIVGTSVWVPQIFRNAVRNCRKALRWEFVIGESILRLTPAAYVYLFEGNIIGYEPDPQVFYSLVGWTIAQVLILSLQGVFGPRWGIPKDLLPPAYDYHPVLREDDETARIISGFTESSVGAFTHTMRGGGAMRERKMPDLKEDKHRQVFDCAICMQAVQVPVIPASSYAPRERDEHGRKGSGRRFLWRTGYMITPCRHVFHTKCLEAAMRYRLQCPICREGLPAL